VSPLRDLILSHASLERLYLEARWSSVVPYAAAAGLLADVLPIKSGANATTLREHTLRVAERVEAELEEERPFFIDGCPTEWGRLPIPEGRIVVGLDGGYVRNWDDRKTNFEVIVGQSVPEDRDARYVGLVHTYDPKPKRRLFDLLKSQGLQANQDVTFLTDGGEEIRALTEFVTPESEHVLDWFHITMRITVLSQYARGVAQHDDAAGKSLLAELERIKWLLWHGNQYRAGETIKFFLDDVGALDVDYPNLSKIHPCRAGVFRVHRLKRCQPDKLWRAISRRRTYLLVPGGIIGERRHQQALRQTSTDAVDEARSALAATDPNPGARWDAAVSLRGMVSPPRQRQRGRGRSSRGGIKPQTS
jgi:hypothetical protein